MKNNANYDIKSEFSKIENLLKVTKELDDIQDENIQIANNLIMNYMKRNLRIIIDHFTSEEISKLNTLAEERNININEVLNV